MKAKIFLTLFLFIFSIFYLKKAIFLIQDHDKLMHEIREKAPLYEKNRVDAIITSHTIIPGISGKKVNLRKSYQKMKAVNTFQESLLVYDEIKPIKSINKYYDKIILQGNPLIKQVSMIIISDDALPLNDLPITSFTFHEENCLTYNLNIKPNCLKKRQDTFLGHLITKPFFTNTQNILQNGYILVYQMHKEDFNEIKMIIKYLKNNNYQIVSLKDLIKE